MRRALLVPCLLLVFAVPKPAPMRPVSKTEWKQDVDTLAREIVKRHMNAFHAVTRDRQQRSLEELLALELKRQRLPSAVYVVHRLDTGTSGVVVFARTSDAAASLSALFASRALRKTYLARVDGVIDAPLTIDSPIAGKPARTAVRPLSNGLVEALPETGRTHQIRIHLASIGHPVVGDRRYGGSKAKRLMLHAWRLEHETIGTIEAAPPPDL